MKQNLQHRMHLIALAASVAIGSASAVEWNPLNWFKPRRVQSLLICGNVVQPRLLAEVAQRKTHDSFLILAPETNGDMYLMAPDFTATKASEEQIAEMVGIIGPQQVIIIGDSFYFPQVAADQLNGRYPVIIVRGDDWRKNAEALSRSLDWADLPKEFGEKLLELESKLALPEPAPALLPAVVPPAKTAPLAPPPTAPEGEGTVTVMDSHTRQEAVTK